MNTTKLQFTAPEEQALLRDILTAIEAVPESEGLIPGRFQNENGQCCVMGAYFRSRGELLFWRDLGRWFPTADAEARTYYDRSILTDTIVQENNDFIGTPTERLLRMRAWIKAQLVEQ